MLKRMGHKTCTLPLAAVLIAGSAAVSQTEAAPVFQDSFDREGVLDGSTPDVRPGSETWTAENTDAPVPSTDGSALTFEADRRNMFLPFTPGSAVYELSVDVKLDPTDDSSEWHGLGFMGAEPAVTGENMAFGDDTGGRPWVLLRNNGAALAFAGPGTGNNLGGPDAGTFASDVFHTLRVVLDTTGAQWTVNADINGTAIGSGFTYDPGENPDIGSIGLTGSGGSGFDFTFDNFQLVPEPTSLALLGVGGLALIRRRVHQ